MSDDGLLVLRRAVFGSRLAVQQAEIVLLTEFLDARDVGGADSPSDGKPQRYASAKTLGGGRAEPGTSVTVRSRCRSCARASHAVDRVWRSSVLPTAQLRWPVGRPKALCVLAAQLKQLNDVRVRDLEQHVIEW